MSELNDNFNWKSKDDIRLDLFNEAKANLPKITNYNSGGVFRTFLEIVAEAVYSFYVLLSNVIRQAFVQTAEGGWLDLKCEEIGITRKPATKTEGIVVFSRENADPVNIVIPSGTILKTKTDSKGKEYRFFTTEETILSSGSTSVNVPVVAEFEGAAYNVGANTITELVSAIPGIDSVNNETNWITKEGTDQETDEDLRERYYLKWEELARGSTKMAYVGYTKEVNGVVDVEVDDSWPRGQGTVDIYITGTNGMPTQTLIDEVQAVINDKKPICSDALVKAPEPVVLNATFNIEIFPGQPLEGLQAEIENIVNALFIRSEEYSDLEDLRFKIGDDITEDRFITAINRRIKNIKKIDCGFDIIPVQISQIATKGTIVINISEASER